MSANTHERNLIHGLYHAVHQARLKGPFSDETARAFDSLRTACQPFVSGPGLELRVVRRTLYLNRTALVQDVENFVFYRHVVDMLRRSGIGILHVTAVPSVQDFQIFLGMVARLSQPGDDPTRSGKLTDLLSDKGITSIRIEPPLASAATLPGERERRETARRTYEESVAISRELFNGTRMGRSANVKKVKLAVQSIVDGVLNDEASLGGLSALKDYDEYAFTHAVNVCIFCVAIGRRLGLTKAQLYDLGHAALVHDIGMSRIPRSILTKGSSLTDEELEHMRAHTWLGALSIFELRDFGEIPFQSMIVAYEHHLGPDESGYPKVVRPRVPSVFSKIVAVAAAFDAATNERSYRKALPADEVLRAFWEDRSMGFDPVIVKALINLLGIYPVGTVVILDTYELALVHAANSDPASVHRPIVRLLSDPDGLWITPPPLVDLARTNEKGEYERSIIKVTSADRYGIDVATYFA